MTDNSSLRLIHSLQNPDVYGHGIDEISVLETHISWVVLTGPFAYKIKKPVDLGFVDFTTLERREFFCHEELRLNRRFAAQLYLDVISITGTPDAPELDGPGPSIEYAVKMIQFPQEALLSHLLENESLLPEHIDGLAQEVAEFHNRIDVAPNESPFGIPEQVMQPVRENFRHLSEDVSGQQSLIQRLQNWSEREFVNRKTDFENRKRAGFIRECHGDIHLGNLILLDGKVTLFDCIEFNESFRWIDVLSEVAFCTMDLEDRGRSDLGHRFLNGYLEQTGDYAGLVVFLFYLTYRALVRAKVSAIRFGQPGLTDAEREQLRDEFRGYLTLAEGYTKPSKPLLMIAHGFSGSGKTYCTQSLVESLGAIRIKSDIERKRLFGLGPLEQSESKICTDMYSSDANERTDKRLADATTEVIKAGFSVVADATFLKRADRDRFRVLAEKLDVPLLILDFQASKSVLKERISQRNREKHDASEADLDVLEHQFRTHEPLQEEELKFVISVESEDADATGRLLPAIKNYSVSCGEKD